MKDSEKLKSRTLPWTFILLGETAAVILLNLLPYIIKMLLEKDEVFWLNAVFGVPLIFLSLFSICIFRAANQRRLFKRLCEKKCASLSKSSFFGSAVLSLVLLAFKATLFVGFILPAIVMLFSLERVAEAFPIEATAGFFAFCLLLAFLGLLFFRKACSLLFLSEYIYLIYPEMNAAQCIKLSTERASACRKECRRLRLKLFAFSLLCIFVFTVPYALHRCRLLKNELAFDLLFVLVE